MRNLWSAAPVLWLLCWVGCGDDSNAPGGGGGGGSAPVGGTAEVGPRVALRVVARADLIVRDAPLLRVAAPLEVGLSAAEDIAAWSITVAGAALPLEPGTLFVFPAIGDANRAGAAVWLLPQAGSAGDMVEVSLNGEVLFSGALARTEVLAAVDVAPIVVRTPAGEGPSATNAEVADAMASFGPLLASGCNLRLAVRDPSEVVLAGFDQLEETDFVSVDDEAILAELQEATGEDVGVLLSERLEPLYSALTEVAPGDSRVVRAIVFAQHQSPEQANTIVPAFFHNELAAELYGISPYYAGPTLSSYWFDPENGLAEQTLRRETESEREATFAIYFGSDHLEAFAHELGHLLGLPHPQQSSVIDSSGGPGSTNVMDGAAECLPDCGATITPHQCEIMLLGMTGFLSPP